MKALAIAAFALAATPAMAEVCGKTDAVLAAFKTRYDETPVWTGEGPDGSVYVILQSAAGTWTALRVKGDLACGIVSGDKAELVIGDPA